MMRRIIIPIAQGMQRLLLWAQWSAFWLGFGASWGGHALDRWITARLRALAGRR
jgi:hypothetical protein